MADLSATMYASRRDMSSVAIVLPAGFGEWRRFHPRPDRNEVEN
ncbi:hypothetical protein [Roseiflexus sp.]|nr:hypothetical protein [Roseiflexus sp.]